MQSLLIIICGHHSLASMTKIGTLEEQCCCTMHRKCPPWNVWWVKVQKELVFMFLISNVQPWKTFLSDHSVTHFLWFHEHCEWPSNDGLACAQNTHFWAIFDKKYFTHMSHMICNFKVNIWLIEQQTCDVMGTILSR